MVFTRAVQEGWSRRAVLGAAGAGAAGLASGCSWFDSSPPPPDPPDPLEPLLASTRALMVRYARTAAVHPELTDRLAPLRDTHEQHLAALRDLIGAPEPATPPAATPSPGPGIPADDDAAVDALREAEQDGRDEAAQACLDAAAARTVLLGAICAARATHLEVLG